MPKNESNAEVSYQKGGNNFRKCLHVKEGILVGSGSGLSKHEDVEAAGGWRQLGVVTSHSMKRFGH